MFDLYYCLTRDHNLWLVLLAGLVCDATTGSAVFLLRHVRAAPERARVRWLIAAGFASGTGIWATHFVAMLGYDPGIVAGYLPGRTLASTLVGGGVAGMHYLGMSAVLFPGRFSFAASFVIASVLFAIAPVLPALHLAIQGRRAGSAIGSASLLTLAILLLHFTGMASISITPSAVVGDGGITISPTVMGPLIAVAALAVLMTLVGAAKAKALLWLDRGARPMQAGRQWCVPIW